LERHKYHNDKFQREYEKSNPYDNAYNPYKEE